MFRTLPVMKSVGLIGVGKMGEAIAKNLVAVGHNVSMFDVNTSNVEKIAASDPSNLTALPSVREVAESCSTIVTMLPNDAVLKVSALRGFQVGSDFNRSFPPMDV